MADNDEGYPREISRQSLLRGKKLKSWVREELTPKDDPHVLKGGQFVKPDDIQGRFFGSRSKDIMKADPGMERTPLRPEPGPVVKPEPSTGVTPRLPNTRSTSRETGQQFASNSIKPVEGGSFAHTDDFTYRKECHQPKPLPGRKA
jgi:hypothetical protein